MLKEQLGDYAQSISLQSLYQFEARFFQCSLLRNNVLFITDYNHRHSNSNSNFDCNSTSYNYYYDSNVCNVNNGKRYMIFKFGRASIENGAIYAICEENNRFPMQQPWHCKYVMTYDELVQFFNSTTMPSYFQDKSSKCLFNTNNNTNNNNNHLNTPPSLSDDDESEEGKV